MSLFKWIISQHAVLYTCTVKISHQNLCSCLCEKTIPLWITYYIMLFFFFSKCIAIVLQNNQTEQEIYVIFGIILYKYNNIIDKYLLGKNAWKVDDQRLMFVLKIWVYRHDLNKYLSCDENIIINLIPLQWIIFSGTKLLEPIFSWIFKGTVKIISKHQN
jgi:hypothetical protein